MAQEPQENVDRFGAIASSLCALHCALCAFLPALFAAFGLGFLLSHQAEWFLTLVAVLFGGVALSLAWRTHRSGKVLGLLLLGIIGLLASRGIEMGAPHDDHHGDAVHADAVDGEHGHEEHGDHAAGDSDKEEHHAEAGHAHGHDEHGEDESLHLLGAGVGVFSGFLLFFGHLLNIRTARRRRDECCD